MDAKVLNLARCIALLAIILGFSTMARAANNCPWLNEATASGILGGDATGLYEPAEAGKPATCTFAQTESGITRQLVIAVEIVAKPHDRLVELMHNCGPMSQPVPSIGNEALRCAAADGKAHGERVIGRVRDQIFTISITTTAERDSVLAPHELAMRSLTAAEEVSGNLF
ncbi:hypothetical protein [Occallatibacter riparius]|uniref:DUF3558 domain-containing protein n=1 Tax=Occallatibacter riparius TaxID=1002689 RepID=A0A9J7BJS6_9BACT|nr:hypothetical protein [Occallatibacter riparius]UWZ82795.1 hypothetical protein MOP44_19760 [Occallatibacter riparius]